MKNVEIKKEVSVSIQKQPAVALFEKTELLALGSQGGPRLS